MVQKNGLEDYYVIRNQKKLRFGYTTGSCAAGAARGAARLLFGEDEISEVELMTPKGILLHLEILDRKRSENAASCAVRKDAGDDPDTTNGILVYAKVEKFLIRSDMEDRIVIDGGIGVGRVTEARAFPEGRGGCDQSGAESYDLTGSRRNCRSVSL